MKSYVTIICWVALITLVCGCSNQVRKINETGEMLDDAMKLSESYLGKVSKSGAETQNPTDQNSADDKSDEINARDVDETTDLVMLTPLEFELGKTSVPPLPRNQFSDSNALAVSAESMPLPDFVHYVFGELLQINYVLDPSLSSNADSSGNIITLSISEPLSSRDLFDLANQLLVDRGVQIKFSNKTFFIYRPSDLAAGPQIVIGMGRTPSSVPETSQRIMQVVPLKFGVKIALERTLKQLSTAKITPDTAQSAVYIEGTREEVLRGLELVELLDTPAMRGRHIGLLEFTYIDPQKFAEKALVLLENEGIEANIGMPGNRNLVMVPLEQSGALAVFSTNEMLLARVQYWAGIIDVAGNTGNAGPQKQFFTYRPAFSRTQDLGDSVSRLLNIDDAFKTAAGTNSTGNAPYAGRVGPKSEESVDMIVDERANVLVFYTSAEVYRNITPLLRQLDRMPRQVMLDILIAEVSLKDEFKHGVEWALQRSEVRVTTQGAFGAATIGGTGVLIDANDGPITANFLATNSLVNVLSQPTLMVRDGVQATINIGSSISVVGETTQDPINGDRQTTASEYRQTGVDVTVTPTVNDSGIVTMEISQNISNVVPGSSGAGGNPDIFDRSVTTEVIANSGQTIMLAGLISENASTGGSGTPILSKVPLLGNLFKADTDIADRTELVILVTPKVVEDTSGWKPLMEEFRKQMKLMELSTIN